MKIETKKTWGIETLKVCVESEADTKELQKPVGTYFTIDTKRIKDLDSIEESGECLADALKEILKPYTGGTLLIVGLGNKKLVHDCLGPETIDKIPIDVFQGMRAYSPFLSVGKMYPGLAGFNNIAGQDFIGSVARQTGACCIIMIDAIQTDDFSRLLTTIQVSNSGFKSLEQYDQETIGVPIIAIGVTTIYNLKYIDPDSEKEKEEFITKVNIEEDIKSASNLIAYSISRALYPRQSQDECYSYVMLSQL